MDSQVTPAEKPIEKPTAPTTPAAPTPAATTAPTPADKLTQLMQQLVVKCTMLVIKVATCRCEKREACPIYRIAKEIAEIIDEINELRPR